MKIRVLCSLNFPPENMPFMENVEKYVRARQAKSENMMRRMRFACRMTKAVDPVRLCNTYCFSTATVVTRTRLIVTSCVHWQLVSKISLYNIIWWGDWKIVDWKGFGTGQYGIIPVLSWNLSGRTEEENETFRERTSIAVDNRTRFPRVYLRGHSISATPACSAMLL